MVYAKSQLVQAYDDRKERDALVEMATERYAASQADPAGKKSLRTVCDEVEAEHEKATGRKVKISKTTVSEHYKGRPLKSESAAERSWLNPTEVELVINFALESAERGFPLTPRSLEEHVNTIARARHADFPEGGVGENWTDRFIARHHDRLHVYLSRKIDSKRAQAVNPATHAAWFKLLGDTIEKYNIDPDCIYACDESGFMLGHHVRQKVIGGKGKRVQYAQHHEDRENITVLPTICADGTCLPPLVIFKGQAFFVKWGENNPLDAM